MQWNEKKASEMQLVCHDCRLGDLGLEMYFGGELLHSAHGALSGLDWGCGCQGKVC